ncbi:hypothetical protein FHL15_008975 [Xylaria flabelliformis]|uniref:Uncharacterized protein n=1 Tax=Xylaria flabelliformis TaxID=2512241 RepID=A0A553HQ29_9PEZI|nr:hypothetical protein FHL15_008975 [Xylaria flabelliformis]
MSQPAPDSIVRAIANLGQDHLVFEGILTEYCKKPILVYITFWDGDSPDVRKPSLPPHDFGGVPVENVGCIIENYKTAFAPLLASSKTRALYKRIRTQRSKHTESGRILSLYEFRDAADKPIDYLFLENFHKTNIDNAPKIRRALQGFVDIPRGPNESKVDWWPNLIVRLSELWDVMGPYDRLKVDSHETVKRLAFAEIFGVLGSGRVRLQDYLILINSKWIDKRTVEKYNFFEKNHNIHNWRLRYAVKSYDVTEKLPNDITFARIEDFDYHQRFQAKMIEKFMAAWNTVPDLNPPRAFFVRWKTDEEKKKEEKELNERLNPSARCGRDSTTPTTFEVYEENSEGENSTAPLTIEEEMRCQPVLGFTERLDDDESSIVVWDPDDISDTEH